MPVPLFAIPHPFTPTIAEEGGRGKGDGADDYELATPDGATLAALADEARKHGVDVRPP